MAKDGDRIDDEQSNELCSDQSSALAESILKSTAVSKVKCFLRLLEKFLFQFVCSTSLCDWFRKLVPPSKTNQIQNLNQFQLGHSRFPAPYAGCPLLL